MKELVIGDLVAKVPIIQGGMGVGVSLGGLAGAVAKEGGIGVISAAQPGFREDDFYTNTFEANMRALNREIKKAKEISNGGIVGVNIMVAVTHYSDFVKCCIDSGADIIISGAGLPMDLPKFAEGSDIKLAPIVSSAKACKLILGRWIKKFNKVADLVVIEGPKAGGHLGFKVDEISLLITSILFLSKTSPLDNSSVKSLNLLGPIIENTEDAPAKISAIIINGIKLFK